MADPLERRSQDCRRSNVKAAKLSIVHDQQSPLALPRFATELNLRSYYLPYVSYLPYTKLQSTWVLFFAFLVFVQPEGDDHIST